MKTPLSRRRFVAAAMAAAASPAVCRFVRAADQVGPDAYVTADGPAVEAAILEEAAGNVERCRKGNATVRVQTADGTPLAKARVSAKQTSHAFRFGCIVFDLVGRRETYRPDLFKTRFAELFNFAVFPFYWAGYEYRPGQTSRDSIAEVARWCRERGLATKGHPLAWTNRSGVPKWLEGQSVAETEKRLLERIGREVSDFAGLIDIWDVVNEPVNTRVWRNVEGRDYIQEPIDPIADYVEKCLHAAHDANPNAHLIVNEYNTIAQADVRRRFGRLVETLQNRKAPLSGLGIQAHEPRENWYPPRETWATFHRFAEFGLPLHITEFIPQSGGKEITGGWRKGAWTLQAQADFAEQLFRLAFGHPAMQSINWWGFSDRRIWLPGGGLVDDQYDAKPVYHRLHKLIRDEWSTSASGETDQQGRFAFRGFLGSYAVEVTKDGRTRRIEGVLEATNGREVWTCVV